MIRFDARQRRESNDGVDFRDFVGEVFRAVLLWGAPTVKDSGSVDGSIDLFCEETGTVWECKFIGENGEIREAIRVDQEWAGIADKLERNLLSDGTRATIKRAPYRPWANTTKPICRYVFVTSARLSNLGKQQELQDRIQNFFVSKIAIRPGYEHLSKIEVEIYDWSNLSTLLEKYPSLTFRWLRRWPTGFSELSSKAPSGFKSYLYGEKLPYLARDSWSPPSGLHHRWTEQSLTSDIESSKSLALVVTGHGGVGKTRLGLELARRLQTKGWIALHCDGLRVTPTSVRELLIETPSNQKFLLFADYVENWVNFEAFINEVIDLNEATEHIVAVLGTCRSSYRDKLPAGVKQHAVGEQNSFELEYAKAVAQHILTMAGTADSAVLAEKCRYNLALATFLLFLHQEKPQQFHAEINSLRGEENFESWIVKRLRQSGGTNIQAVAAILAACDLPTKTFDSLSNAHGAQPDQLRTMLAADKWIERNQLKDDDAVWAVFHDIFTDVVLTRSFAAAADAASWAEILLIVAVQNGVFQQTVTALARSIGNPSIHSVDWVLRLKELERASPGTLESHSRSILTSNLLGPTERLELLSANASLRHAVEENGQCDVSIALTAAALAKTPTEKYYEYLLPLVDIAAHRPNMGNLIARIAFTSEAERYRNLIRRWFADHPGQMQTHYLLNVWISQASTQISGDKQHARDLLIEAEYTLMYWLDCHPLVNRAMFVITPWISAAATLGPPFSDEMIELIFRHTEQWLGAVANRSALRTGDLFDSWLQACIGAGKPLAIKMINMISGHFLHWLAIDSNHTHREIDSIYIAWIKAAYRFPGEMCDHMLDAIMPWVVSWLAGPDNRDSLSAGIVSSFWLRSAAEIGGRRTREKVWAIQGNVERWLALEIPDASEYAGRLIENWLHAATVVEPPQRSLLAARISPYARKWLATRQGNEAASITGNILRNWLNAASDNDVRVFEEEMHDWIQTTPDIEGCSFLMTAWLDRGLPADAIRQELYDLFLAHRMEERASWLLKVILKIHALPPDIHRSALAWCVRFPENEDTLSRLGKLSFLMDLSPDLMVQAIAWVLLDQRVDNLIRTPYRLVSARKTLATLGSLGWNGPGQLLGKIYFLRWLRDGRVFRPASQFDWNGQDVSLFDQNVVLIQMLSMLIREGEIGSSDVAYVESFAAWVNEWQDRETPFVQAAVEILIREAEAIRVR